jgi:sugar lactone lactonase YvrE
LINCSEEEAPSSSASSPAAPSNYGKGGDVLIDPTDGSWVSSKPTFVITFSDLARSVITDSVSYPGKPNSRLNSFQGSTLCLRASSNSNCENLSVIFNDNLTTATVTPLNSLNEGDYTFLIAGSILTSAGSLGEDQTFRYEVIFPNGGAIQNSLSLGTNAIPFKNLDLDGPRGLATNGTYLYVADTYKEKIKKITLSSSAINSFNLNSLPVESGESPEIRTLLEPVDVTVSSAHLYILDRRFRRVLKVPLAGGTPTSIAGGGSTGYTDGNGISAQFNFPNAITNTKNSLFVADTCNNTIRRIDLDTNDVTSLLPPEPGCGSGSSDPDKLNAPADLTTDGFKLYIADKENSAIKQIDLKECEERGWSKCTLNKLIDLNSKPISIITDSKYLYIGTDNHAIQRYDQQTGASANHSLFPIFAATPRGITTDGKSLIYSEEGRNQIVRLHSKAYNNERY